MAGRNLLRDQWVQGYAPAPGEVESVEGKGVGKVSSAILQAAGKTVLLMGNEAIARGAVEAGLQVMAAYPGTPSSEIGEALLDASRESGFYCEWSTNEKVAFEVAAGAAIVGARAMTAMKNAGLNVAMDTFMTLPYGGCKGGFVIVVADDPDAHYSSTEQDTRLLAAYAEIPCLEPDCQQEAKEMARAAFDISEQLELPVFLRSVSRISHASGDVLLQKPREQRNRIAFNKHYKLPSRWNVYGPPGTLSKHIWLKERYPEAKALAEESVFNEIRTVPGAKVGVIACGLGASYAREALAGLGLADQVNFLKLGFINPLPEKLVDSVLAGLETLILVEEGDPVVENMVRAYAAEKGYTARIYGKRYGGIFPSYGELNTDVVTEAAGRLLAAAWSGDGKAETRDAIRRLVIPRSSTLCAGCSHLGAYAAIREAMRKFPGTHILNGDIGCYEQGGYGIFSAEVEANEEDGKKYAKTSPYEMLDTIYVMGSGIGMAMGQAKAGYSLGKVLAIAGDSTFIHATLPSVVNAVHDGADITFLVLDNYWTCMTGHQPNPNTVCGPDGQALPGFDIADVCRALGVKGIWTASCYDRAVAVAAIAEAMAYQGPAVVLLTGECQLQLGRRVKRRAVKTHVDPRACNGCKRCIQLGCPAIRYDAAAKLSSIDMISCVDCGLCRQFCPQEAIIMEE